MALPPVAAPGRYQVRLEAGGQSATQAFELREDPRIAASQEDLVAQFDLLMNIRDKLTEVHEAVERSRKLRQQVGAWQARLEAEGQPALAEEAKKVAEWLLEAENELVESRSKGAADSFNYPPKVNSKLASLQSTVAYGDSRPPQQCADTYQQLSREADRGIANLREVTQAEIGNLNRKIAGVGLPPIG